MTPGIQELPLHSVRVLELGHIVAGPTAGLILADLGADVIKVERPEGGDQSRTMPAGTTATFHFLNRNKRSFAVNLKQAAGQDAFLRLVASADVVVDNYAHGVLEGLGLGYDRLAEVSPRIIYLALKGFLPGPYAARPSLDELAQMMGGLAFMTGPRGQPLRAGASIIDIGAATYGVLAVLAALLARRESGQGQKITAGLYETTVFWVGQWIARAAATGEPSVPMPEAGQGTRMGWGIYHLFRASDGEQVFIGVTSNAHWERFCQAFGLLDIGADSRLDSNAKRVAAREWLLPRVRAEMEKCTSAEIGARLERAAVPWAPVRRPDELLDDPHLNAADQFIPTPLPEDGTVKMPKLPFTSSAFDFGLRRPAPGLGEHTRELLEEMAYSPAEIEALASAGTVFLGGPGAPVREA